MSKPQEVAQKLCLGDQVFFYGVMCESYDVFRLSFTLFTFHLLMTDYVKEVREQIFRPRMFTQSNVAFALRQIDHLHDPHRAMRWHSVRVQSFE